MSAPHCLTCRCASGVAAVVLTARRRHGLSQAQLASLVGVSQPTISLWEGGHRVPSPEQSARLNAVLGTSLDAAPEGIGREAWEEVL